jgi:hypothetical protein
MRPQWLDDLLPAVEAKITPAERAKIVTEHVGRQVARDLVGNATVRKRVAQ